MARIAQVIAPGIPQHIIQQGNRRQDIFLKEGDQRAYLNILKEQADKNNLCIWAYCLMSNHIHIIAVPESETGLTRAIGETHRRYTRMINFREGWRGYLCLPWNFWEWREFRLKFIRPRSRTPL